MIPWDMIAEDQWRPQVAIAITRPNRCVMCNIQVAVGMTGGAPDQNWQMEVRQCLSCQAHHQYYVPTNQRRERAVMGMNCPQFAPGWMLRPQGVVPAEHESVVRTAHAWLGLAVHYAVLEEAFVAAFNFYALFFETTLSAAWSVRNRDIPDLTLGKLVWSARDEGFLSTEPAQQLTRFITFRNDLVHGRWIDWHHHGAINRIQDVEGNVWSWFFHEDGYLKTTRELYGAFPRR